MRADAGRAMLVYSGSDILTGQTRQLLGHFLGKEGGLLVEKARHPGRSLTG